MSADESFLARWSRRKRGAAPSAPDQAKPETAETGAASEAPASSPPSAEAEAAFDLARLPSIESLGAGSDLSPFLAPGVPVELTRAALRRAWSADPAIRDFIGLSENSWDFNAAGGVPGFAALKPEEICRLLAQLTGETESADSPVTEPSSRGQAPPPASQAAPAEDAAMSGPTGEESSVASQQGLTEHQTSPPLPARRHGGALPK